MNKIITIKIKEIFCLKLWFSMLLALVAPRIVNAQDSHDSLVIDSVAVKFPIQQRHVNLWFRTLSKLRNVAGSTTLYSEDLNTTPVSDLTNALAGRVTGLYSTRSSGQTGPLYDASSLTLRGNTPLIVVDGVIRDFTSFNLDDIKSVTILKDAVATSMYGLRSSGGVIYVTTKDKSLDKPFELGFSAQYGVQQQLQRPNFLSGADYASLYNEAQLNTFPNATPTYSTALIDAYRNGTNDPYLQPTNDWYNSVYKDNAAQQRYSIYAAGNQKNYRYYTSVEHFAQDGNFLTSADNPYETNNYYKRYNFRTNAQIDFSEDIQLGLNIFASIEKNGEPGATAGVIMNRIYQTNPLAYPAYNADGSLGGTTQYTTNILGSTLNSGYNTQNQRSVNADVSLKFKLDDWVKGLWVQGLLSINNYYLQSIENSKTFAVYYPVTNSTGTTYTKIGSDGSIIANSGNPTLGTQSKQTFANGLLGYDATFGKSKLNVLGTFNLTNLIDSYTQLNRIYKNAGLTASYAYDNKYLADIGLVYSSYNRYPPGERWGFLPSIGLGWIASNEDWFNNDVISLLKFRTTIGKTALANTGYYTYLQNYSISTTGYNFGATPTPVSGSIEGTLANPDVTWEKALKLDVGAEIGFFKNKLQAEFVYYTNKYTDQLISPNNGYASGIIGQAYPSVNAGSNRYSGFESNLSFNNTIGNLSYFIKGNFTFAKNKVLSLQEGNYPYDWMYRSGQAIGNFGYEAIGFYQQGENFNTIATIPGYTPQAGDIKYRDLNGDGIINFLDQKLINDKPLYLFGLNLGFAYKNFDFSMLIEGRLPRLIYYNPAQMLAFSNSYGYVLDYTTENRWTPENNINATLPRLTLGNNVNNSQASTFWYKRADYIRLKNAEIGYTFPVKFLSKNKINKLRVFMNGYNLLTWTKLDYMDPETGLSGFVNSRVINGGVSLKL
ncbi:SusC/RagA family TonB-linked outer membrane protein [Pedobacter sp. MW01-1-1]|uniref:SusC/RagA family TonB-linked outer membrane protein n=1 Tax=Pedobacter sp. MW01-1-1 TaxID=3383027 RepID=UPI003FEEF3ED